MQLSKNPLLQDTDELRTQKILLIKLTQNTRGCIRKLTNG